MDVPSYVCMNVSMYVCKDASSMSVESDDVSLGKPRVAFVAVNVLSLIDNMNNQSSLRIL